MSRIKRSIQDIQDDLKDQIMLLEDSCREFDKGKYFHAKNISVSLRKFCKHKGNNSAILYELGFMSDRQFLDTKLLDDHTGDVAGKSLLTTMFLGEKCKNNVVPILDGNENSKYVSFENWWKRVVILDRNGRNLTRETLVLLISEQDGGAHSDTALDGDYFEISRNNSLGFLAGNNQSGFQPLSKETIYCSIRQIGYELLVSLGRKGFEEGGVDWKNDNGYLIGMNGISFG